MPFTERSPKVELGLTLLLTEKHDWIRGKSIGLITNHTGVDANLQSNYRLLAEDADCQLAAIFSPEHGLWGSAQDGIAINNVDENLSKCATKMSLFSVCMDNLCVRQQNNLRV